MVAIGVISPAIEVNAFVERINVDYGIEIEAGEKIDNRDEVLCWEQILQHDAMSRAFSDSSSVVVGDQNGSAYLFDHRNDGAIASPGAKNQQGPTVRRGPKR